MTWAVTEADSGEHHVVPIGDLRPHRCSCECWCEPFDDDGVWVHNSLDGREFIERGERAKN